MNLPTTFSPRIIVTALAFKVTQPDLIRFLFGPLVEVSQQSIVFHVIASVETFLFFWRSDRRSFMHAEHARLPDYGNRVFVPKSFVSGAR